MAPGEFEIVPYRPEFRAEVIDLLRHLWGDDSQANQAYFRWKYEENAWTQSPLAVVALAEGRPVGFRGYFATRFHLPGKSDRIVILCPGDTCVHPDYRQHGLSVAMGKLAMREFAPDYRLFLNLSCNRASLPGYLRMGFLPLADKAYLTWGGLGGLVRYLRAQHDAPLKAGRTGTGSRGRDLKHSSGRTVASRSPRPEEMAALLAAQTAEEGRLHLFQDEAFYRWRFNNPRKTYRFYYLPGETGLAAFAVVGLSANGRRAYLLDWAGVAAPALREILLAMTAGRQFDLISVYGFAVDRILAEAMTGLGFQVRSLMRNLEKRRAGELPALVRPVQESFGAEDLLVEGLDVRQIANWALKPIASDAA